MSVFRHKSQSMCGPWGAVQAFVLVLTGTDDSLDILKLHFLAKTSNSLQCLQVLLERLVVEEL